MQNIKGYVPTSTQDLGSGLLLCECEKDGNTYEVLLIHCEDKHKRMLDRILQNEIKPLINRNIIGIQKIVDVDSLENGDSFVAYESIEDLSYDFETMKNIVSGLNILKKENMENFIISPKTIKSKLKFIGLFGLFRKLDLLDIKYLSPNVNEWLQNTELPPPNFQDDIYSIVKYFEPFLEKLNDENAKQILQRGLAEERAKRFKYHELLNLLDKISLQNRAILRVVIKDEATEEFLQILEDMNKNCELYIESKKGEQEQIAVKFCTDSFMGVFYVDEGRDYRARNYVFIPTQNCKPRNGFIPRGNNWFLADFSFSLERDSTFNSFNFFTEKFEKINQLAEFNKTKKESVNKWQIMPEKEKEFIEKNAFHVKYKKWTYKETTNNAVFYLEDEYENWEMIKHKKEEKITLWIDGVKIGKIGDLHQNKHIFIVNDILCKSEEIPENGELIEDVRQKVSQFKKQVEACQKFSTLDVVNPDLCSILATPEAEIPPNKILEDYEYDNFKNEVFNKNLLKDDSQLEAVLEFIHYKPIYLIQGPPGTGKTTVIVEAIRQIIKKESNAKILVTSQSNLAVDNVLERIEEINQKEDANMLYMRLASESEDGDINVTEIIKPHTYENKLKNWVNNTWENSQKFMEKEFAEQEKNKRLVDFYNATYKVKNFDEFREKLKNVNGQYIKNLFEYVKNLKEKDGKFTEILGDEFLKLKGIQRDWFAFLNNVTAKNKKLQSKLNNGSGYIDFLTAMMMNTNIIGATCIHIASSKYSDINFKFDYVIMDESSKASPAETIVPINMGRNIILIGDHKQLPPIITREDAVKKEVETELEDNGLDFEKEFGESLFEKLITAFENDESKQQYIKMLDIQYRMPKQIGDLISKFFYDNKLKNPSDNAIPDFDIKKNHGLNLKKETSIVFLSTSKMDNCNDNNNKYKRQNQCNMKYIKDILTKLNKLYADNLQKKKPFTIGIIAGYRGQVELLKQSVNVTGYNNFVIASESGDKENLIDINTVDKFQGAERDIIIYDIVRSDKGNANIGFLDDYRRINVAFSRAKRLLIIVGDSEYLIKRATLNPNGKFKEFKLQQIAQELQEQGFVFNNLEEVF